MTDPRRDYIRTNVLLFDTDNRGELDATCSEMAEHAVSEFANEGVDSEAVSIERSADLRYAGQEHTVTTPLATDTDGTVTPTTIETAKARFHSLHEKTYIFRLNNPVEVVNLRLTATHPVEKPEMVRVETDGTLEHARKNNRPVDFGDSGKVETPVYERERLPVGINYQRPNYRRRTSLYDSGYT